MIVFDDRYGYDIDLKQLNLIKESLTSKEVELISVDNDEISQINFEFRAKDTATDVLSFPLEDMPNSPLGSIIINIDIAKERANELNHTVDDEISLLFIHALLHLLGYDHEDDDGQMRSEEEKLIKKFELPDSLIVRNS